MTAFSWRGTQLTIGTALIYFNNKLYRYVTEFWSWSKKFRVPCCLFTFYICL